MRPGTGHLKSGAFPLSFHCTFFHPHNSVLNLFWMHSLRLGTQTFSSQPAPATAPAHLSVIFSFLFVCSLACSNEVISFLSRSTVMRIGREFNRFFSALGALYLRRMSLRSLQRQIIIILESGADCHTTLPLIKSPA